jgi:hypothetical protein
VAIYGGFPSSGDPNWNDRDPNAYETILSGDIGTPDVNMDNSYHVVTGNGTYETAVIDGFIISGGNANGSYPYNRGGGMHNLQGSPTVTNCTFIGNLAGEDGGGMYNRYSSSPIVNNCAFNGNWADQDGGGVCNFDNSNPTLIDCSFSGNWAGDDGGGVYNQRNSNPTLINCSFTGNSVGHDGGGIGNWASNPTLNNCTFSGNSAIDDGGGIWCWWGSSPTITGCTINGNTAGGFGGGVYSDPNGSPTVNNCTISNNGPDGIWAEGDGVRIVGTVYIISNNLAGGGTLQIDPDATLDVDNSIILCSVSGTGTVHIDAEAEEVVIGGDAVIDLNDPNDPGAKGGIDCNGLLRITDKVKLINADIKITRASFEDSFEDDSSISKSIITIDSNAPYGQFFIDPNVTMMYNDIYADGDRYMEMDPSVFEGVMQYNRIFVTITEGVGQAQGGLFELRGEDGLAWARCGHPEEFMCPVYPPRTVPDCNVRTWTIERLELIEGAKLNLTNRFPFQPPYEPGTDDDVLYVKELILRKNSVLNTSFNWVYYGLLYLEPDAVIKNEPLLGFSLINIALDDDVEFRVRVTHNNFEHPEDPNYNRIHVTRVEGNEPDPNGMMQMCTIVEPDPNSPAYGQVVNAQAKGMFAKASEGQIFISFEYMFVEDPCGEAELVVYLSDKPQVGDNLVEVARIRPPKQGRPGSVGSGSFTTFSGHFPSGNLEFNRGTYIELELRGTDTCCLIDDWDPSIYCAAICGDFDGYGEIDIIDYLLLLAEFGLAGPASVGKGCLDIVTDGCVNTDDLRAWGIDEVLHLCPVASSALAKSKAATGKGLLSVPGLKSQSAFGSEPLLIFGNPSDSGYELPDGYLYSVDVNGTCTGEALEPACPTSSCVENNGRLVRDGDGNIYQINGNLGLVRQDTASVVIGPNVIDDGNNVVSIGFSYGDGHVLLDVAFNRCDSSIVYIVPVLVEPYDGNCPYMAAAKLQLTGANNYNLVQLYGKNPATDPCQSHEPNDCEGDLVYEPDLQHLREIEIDSGGNLFVLSSHWVNANNWILIYDEAVGNDSEVRVSLNDVEMVGPTAMVVSSSAEKLYLASSTLGPEDEPNGLTTGVHSFSIEPATGLTYDGRLDINCPEPSLCTAHPSLCDVELGFIRAITAMTENPDDGTLYVTGFTAPKFPEEELPSEVEDFVFTTPMLGVLPPDTNETVEAVEITNCVPGQPLALPLSIVWAAPPFGGADLSGDRSVNLDDFVIFAQHWLEAGCAVLDDCSGADMDKSDAVGWEDLAVLAQRWLEAGCSQ